MGKNKKKLIELGLMNTKRNAIINLYSQWMRIKQDELVEWFRNNGYYSIVIYGMSYLGINLFYELENTDINVEYAIDKNAKNIYCNISILTPDQELDEADAVIVTAFLYYDEIKKQLRKCLKCPIISLEDIVKDLLYKKCSCCGKRVLYKPLSSSYVTQEKKFSQKSYIWETINRKEYFCPKCGATDRERMIVAFMHNLGLERNCTKESLLQIAPSEGIEYWIHNNCCSLTYHSTDQYMEEVTFTSDIQNMNQVENEKYDYIICSHVLEHVQDDKKAMYEMYRILKSDGLICFLVPICLNIDKIDEKWGLSEEENWKRFGQGDHCRLYAKRELMDRLKEVGFYVHCLGKSYFGEYLFRENALMDTSTLYVLTKQKCEIEELVLKKWKKHNL